MGHKKCLMKLLNQTYPFAGFWDYTEITRCLTFICLKEIAIQTKQSTICECNSIFRISPLGYDLGVVLQGMPYVQTGTSVFQVIMSDEN